MRLRRYLLPALLATMCCLVGCKKKAFHEQEMPRDPLAFRTALLHGMGPALEKTLCQCCGKTLKKCYEETLQKEGPSCPDT